MIQCHLNYYNFTVHAVKLMLFKTMCKPYTHILTPIFELCYKEILCIPDTVKSETFYAHVIRELGDIGLSVCPQELT